MSAASRFTIEECRRFYAEEVRALAALESPALIRAFAQVPRERFLGPAPWFVAPGFSLGPTRYRSTQDARDLYHDLLVALHPAQFLNNGQPSMVARLIAALDLRAGGRVLHVGCGAGYFTAILAETVGEQGAVLALEIESDLAAKAAANLRAYPQVTVLNRDAAHFDPGDCDAILVNASVTHPYPAWLNRLSEGGVLVLPLAVARSTAANDALAMRIERQDGSFAAEAVSILTLYPCAGLRDAGEQLLLNPAFENHDLLRVRSLRVDPHPRTETCVVHAPSYCLSALDSSTAFSPQSGA
jgi:protein-L-isoaspartate(D-aspartate) O-methyltransferase